MSVEAKCKVITLYLNPDNLRWQEGGETYAIRSLDWGENQTVAEVRRECWIPHLQLLTKSINKTCCLCKRLQLTAFNNPPSRELVEDQTVGSRHHVQVI